MPQPPKTTAITKAWLEKAAGDIGVARYLLERTPLFDEHAVFCCQQAVEKSIKALLVWKSIEFDKIHNIASLIVKIPDCDASLKSLLQSSEKLSPFAVVFRYPGEDEQVSPEEAQEALAIAVKVHHGILAVLPADCHPAKV